MSTTADNYLFWGIPKSGKTTFFSIMAHTLQTKLNTIRKISMSTTADNYLFLGMPKSGKTTFFSIMAHALQTKLNTSKDSNLVFKYGEDAENFVDECVEKIKAQKWPDKTQKYKEGGYSFELEEVPSTNWLGRLRQKCLFDFESTKISYQDYPGEVCEAVFGREGKDVADKDGQDDVKNLRAEIGSAKGIFLILDAEAMFNGTGKKELKKTITGMFRVIREENPKVKLAVIFNKLETFSEEALPEFIEKFREEYGNAYSYLRLLYNYKLFDNVHPLGEVVEKDGYFIPPKEIKPQNILEPLEWMLDRKFGE